MVGLLPEDSNGMSENLTIQFVFESSKIEKGLMEV